MGLLTKLKSILVGNTEDKKPAEINTTSASTGNSTNSINNQASLMKSIEKVLKGYYKGQKYSFTDKILRVWVQDGLLLDSLRESKFSDELAIYLDNEMDACFTSIELHQGPIPAKNNFTQVNNDVYLEICSKTKPVLTGRAEIMALPKYGSLLKKKYILDSHEIEKLPSQRYNIGIGEYPNLNVFRQNHIVIDDDPENPEFDKNKYVSRKHAYIRYSQEEGFLLQAELDGTNKAGKRTRILRNDAIVDVDEVVAQPLKDGDCIELSKNVRLIFKVLN